MSLSDLPLRRLVAEFRGRGATRGLAVAAAQSMKERRPFRDIEVVDDHGRVMPPPTAAEARANLQRRLSSRQ